MQRGRREGGRRGRMGGWEEETSMHAGASANGSAVDRGERGRGERSEETGGGGDSSTKSRGRRDGEEETNRLLAGIDACLVIGRESRGRGLLVGSVADWRGVRMGRRRSSRWVGGVCARMAASLRRWGPVVLVVLLAREGRKAGGHGEERKTAASSERRGRWGGGGAKERMDVEVRAPAAAHSGPCPAHRRPAPCLCSLRWCRALAGDICFR